MKVKDGCSKNVSSSFSAPVEAAATHWRLIFDRICWRPGLVTPAAPASIYHAIVKFICVIRTVLLSEKQTIISDILMLYVHICTYIRDLSQNIGDIVLTMGGMVQRCIQYIYSLSPDKYL